MHMRTLLPHATRRRPMPWKSRQRRNADLPTNMTPRRSAAKCRARRTTEQIFPMRIIAKVTDIGLTSKQVHKARKVRDAERKSPGVVRRTLGEQLGRGEAPTRADIKRVLTPKPTEVPAPPSWTTPVIAAHSGRAKAGDGMTRKTHNSKHTSWS